MVSIKEDDLRNNLKEYTSKKYKNRNRKRVEGAGIFDFVKKGYESVKSFFDPYKDYRPIVKDFIKKYGDWKVYKIVAFRKPIMSVLDKVLNLISNNKFDEGKKLSNFDEMYHLGLIIMLGNMKGEYVNLLIEKNERIDIEKVPLSLGDKYGELKTVPVTKDIRFNQMLENARKGMGERKFLEYDPFLGNNCQVFAKSLLEYSGLLTPDAEQFIYQPLDKILEVIPKSTPKIARAVTQLGAFFANIGSKITGRGDGELHAVIVKKPVNVEELKEIQNRYIKGNKKFIRETKGSYRIRNIPKQKFIKDSFRTVKINNKISLVYGKLKVSGGIVSRDLSKIMKEAVPAKIKQAYDFISALPKIPSGKKPIIAKTKEERLKLRKDWEEENKEEMMRVLHMTADEKKAYREAKQKEYNDYMSKPDVKKKVEEDKKKEEREYGERATKMVEKAKKFSSLKKLIDELKGKKEEIKETASKYLDRNKVKKIIDDYNDDMKKVEEYDFYNIKNEQLRDQLDKQYMKMYENMMNRPKTYGHLPNNKNYEYGRYRDDPRYIKYIYDNYGKPEPDFLINIFDTVSDFIGDIPVIGDIFTPVNELVQGEIRKVDRPKKGEELPDVDYSRGYEEVENLEQNIQKAQNVGEEVGKLEGEQAQLEQQQREVVGSGKKYDFRKLLKELGITQKQYLDIMSKIAKKNGYNGTLKISKDGVHKLEYEGVGFGKSDYMDYVLYLLSEGEEVARKHRDSYLKRTAKMKGNWKKDNMSANNLSRIIIWDEKNII